MNERIKELYDQCFVVLEDQSPNTGFDFEKFAELIVRDCLDVVGNTNPCPPGTIKMYSLLQDEYFDKGWQVAVETKSNQIKKHFGVEE